MLTEILLAFTVVCVSPGPANLGLAAAAMAAGPGPALRMALGLTLGLSVWGVAAALGLGAVLAASEPALVALKLAGAAYLFWLAFGSARSAARRARPAAGEGGAGRGGWAARGLLLNLSNPKAVFAWMAALAMGLDAGSGPGAVAVATLACMAIGLLNYLGWALVFSRRGAMAAYASARRGIEAATAGLFALAGFGLLRSGLAR